MADGSRLEGRRNRVGSGHVRVSPPRERRRAGLDAVSLAAWRSAAIGVAVESLVLLAGVLAGHAVASSRGTFAFDWDVALVVWIAAGSLVVWTFERAVTVEPRRLGAPARRR